MIRTTKDLPRKVARPKKSFARKVITNKPKMIMPLLLGLLAVGMLSQMIFSIPAQNSNTISSLKETTATLNSEQISNKKTIVTLEQSVTKLVGEKKGLEERADGAEKQLEKLKAAQSSVLKNQESAVAPQAGSIDNPSNNDPFKERNTDPFLRKSLAKTQGQGWNIHPASLLQMKTSQECHWHDFVATSGNAAKMCLHDEKDAVSRSIRGKGRFHHCDILPRLWAETTKTPNSVYLEIGANIGSCVMEMLLSTDAKIIAFEPHPYNGWVLQQTIQNLDPSLQRRVVLVPVGLGSESATSKIFASPSNMGNSVVGKVIKDAGSQSNSDFVEHEIHIEPLSAILDANSGMDVPLVKLDAQGFECQILQGIDPPLAKTISKIKLEVAPKWLRQQGCLDLYQGFQKLGFTVRREGSKKILQGEIPMRGMFEAIATKKDSL